MVSCNSVPSLESAFPTQNLYGETWASEEVPLTNRCLVYFAVFNCYQHNLELKEISRPIQINLLTV